MAGGTGVAAGSSLAAEVGGDLGVAPKSGPDAETIDLGEIRSRAAESNVLYIGKEPRLVDKAGDELNPVQQRMCHGISDAHASVSGNINISMQYLAATATNFELNVEGRVQGDITISAQCPGMVGGSLKVALEAKTLGVDVVDADPQGGGFADKTVIVSHAQLHPLKVVFGAGMNFFDQFEVEVGSALPGPDSVTVTTTQMRHVDVQDVIGEDGVRCITLSPGTPPKG